VFHDADAYREIQEAAVRGYRAKLKPVQRRHRKTGEAQWFARGFVPVRQADGTFGRRRVEHRIAGRTVKERQVECDRLNKEYEDVARNVPLTFAKAYLAYVGAGHPSPLYAENILEILGVMQCHSIDDAAVQEARKHIFKHKASPAYVNRHLYTPILAILRMALKEAAPSLQRPVGHADVTPIEIPPDDWYAAVLPHMSPPIRALVLVLATTGRRLGDALGRRPADFDSVAMTLMVGRTKSGDPLLIDLHPIVNAAIAALCVPKNEKRRKPSRAHQTTRPHTWLFRYGPGSASSVRREIKAACTDAGVPYFSPHKFGRHALSTRLLRAGKSLELVRRAGGWATIRSFSGHSRKRPFLTR
jgi:integrase